MLKQMFLVFLNIVVWGGMLLVFGGVVYSSIEPAQPAIHNQTSPTPNLKRANMKKPLPKPSPTSEPAKETIKYVNTVIINNEQPPKPEETYIRPTWLDDDSAGYTPIATFSPVPNDIEESTSFQEILSESNAAFTERCKKTAEGIYNDMMERCVGIQGNSEECHSRFSPQRDFQISQCY